MAGRRYVPPAPGMIASLVSGRASEVLEERTRKLVHSASSSPPPRAGPEMDEMVGIGRAARRLKVRRREVRKVWTLMPCQGFC